MPRIDKMKLYEQIRDFGREVLMEQDWEGDERHCLAYTQIRVYSAIQKCADLVLEQEDAG